MSPPPVLAHLLVQGCLEVQRFVRHEELPGGLCHGLGAGSLRRVLDLTDHQAHRVPGGGKMARGEPRRPAACRQLCPQAALFPGPFRTSNPSFLLVCWVGRRMSWEVPAGCPARLGCKGTAPRPCQAVCVAPRHGRAGLLAGSAAVDVSIPTPRSSLTHPYPGKHLHLSSTLGNASVLESFSIPAPGWRKASVPAPAWGMSPSQPGGHLRPRPSLENISIPALN